MSEVFDYVGAMIIGSIIVLMILGLYFNIMGTAAASTLDLIVQESLSSTTELLEYDFRLMGYRISDSVKVTRADSNAISFKGDFDDNGTPDSISYYIGKRSGVNNNPNAFILYRRLNKQQMVSNGAATMFRLWYYDAQGIVVTGGSPSVLSKIRAIKVAINAESKAPYDGDYMSAYWERVIKPKNVR